MDLGKVITALMGVLMIAFCLVTSVLYLLPLYHKIELDQLCRSYLNEVNVSEGMSTTRRNELESELVSSGLTEVQIIAPNAGTLKRRERQTFQVSGTLQLREASGFLQFESRTVRYEFKGWAYGKRIIN